MSDTLTLDSILALSRSLPKLPAAEIVSWIAMAPGCPFKVLDGGKTFIFVSPEDLTRIYESTSPTLKPDLTGLSFTGMAGVPIFDMARNAGTDAAEDRRAVWMRAVDRMLAAESSRG